MMNLRCSYCQTLYTVGRDEMLSALQKMEAEHLTHYDTYCPRCRRANPVPRERMEWAFPNWRQALEERKAEPAGMSASQTSGAAAPASAPSTMGSSPAMPARPAASPMAPAPARTSGMTAAKPAAAKKAAPAKKVTVKKAAKGKLAKKAKPVKKVAKKAAKKAKPVKKAVKKAPKKAAKKKSRR